MLLTPQPDRNTASAATNAKRRKVAERTMRFLRQDKSGASVTARRDNSIASLVALAAQRFGAAAAGAVVPANPAGVPAQAGTHTPCHRAYGSGHGSPLSRGRLLSCIAIVALTLLSLAPAPAQERPTLAPPPVTTPVIAQHGMVVAQEARAAK